MTSPQTNPDDKKLRTITDEYLKSQRKPLPDDFEILCPEKREMPLPVAETGDVSYGVDWGKPEGDETALAIAKDGIFYNFLGDEANAILALVSRERAEADRAGRLNELKTLQVGAYHAPFNSPETAYDALVKQRLAELEALTSSNGGKS